MDGRRTDGRMDTQINMCTASHTTLRYVLPVWYLCSRLYIGLYHVDEWMLKTLMSGVVKGDRQPGRPAWKWIDNILMWCGHDIKGVITMTEDRDKWTTFVASPYGPCWPPDHRRRRWRKGLEQNGQINNPKWRWSTRNIDAWSDEMGANICVEKIARCVLRRYNIAYCNG